MILISEESHILINCFVELYSQVYDCVHCRMINDTLEFFQLHIAGWFFCQHFITMLKFVHSLGLHNIVAYRIYNINISSWTCNVLLLLLHCPLVLHFIIVYWFFTSSFSFLERITYINWYHQVHISRYSIPKQESITEREHEQAKGRHFRRYHKILVREFRQQFQGICVRRFSSLQSS